jgi:PAS domain S-box-containing protein
MIKSPAHFLEVCPDDPPGDFNAEPSTFGLLALDPTFVHAMEFSPLPMALLGMDGGYLAVNKRFCELMGCPQEELLASSVEKYVHSVDLVLQRQAFERLVSGASISEKFDLRLRHNLGNYIRATASVSLYKKATKGTPFLLVYVEPFLRKSDQPSSSPDPAKDVYEFAIEGSGIGVWDWDVKTNQAFFSDNWKAMMGYAPDEVRAEFSSWQNLVHPDDLQRCQADLQRYFRGNTPIYKNTHRLRCKDGRYRWVLAIGRVVSWDGQHLPLRMVGTHTDISDNKHTEIRLSRLAQRLSVAVEAAQLGIFTLDWNSETIDGDSRFFECMGVSARREGLSLAGWLDLFSSDHLQKISEGLDDLRSADWPVAFEVDLRRKRNGRVRTARCRLISVRDEPKPYAIGVVTDITFQRETTESLLDALEKATEAAQAKSLFVANMSHEVRTPLNAIIGLTDIATRQIGEVNYLDFLQKIKQAGDSLLAIVNDILDFSKIEARQMSVERQPFELDPLLFSLADLYAPQAMAKGVEFKLVIAEDLPTVIEGDAQRINQVLMNFLNNAVKFTSDGVVELTVVRRSFAGVEGIEFTVSDTGIGLTAAQQKRLFQAFSQADSSTSRKYGGTGLGLSISKSLAELMAGTVYMQSKFSRGSSFSLALPLVVPISLQTSRQFTPVWECKSIAPATMAPLLASPMRAVKSNDTLPMPLDGLHILVAEDNAVNQLIVQSYLESAGATVKMVGDGLEALTTLQNSGPWDFNLILMDVQMPNMDGLQATRKIRQLAQGRHVPIIGLTAHALPEELDRCITAGMNDHLTKPIDADLLTQFVEQNAIRPPAGNKMAESEQLITGIDLPFLKKQLQNDDALLERILCVAFESHRLRPQLLAQAFNAGDLNKFTRECHTIKGMAGSMGAYSLMKQAGELEQLAVKGEALSEELVHEFIRGLDQMFDSIQKFLGLPAAT